MKKQPQKQSQLLYHIAYCLATVVLRIAHPVWRITGKENVPPDPYILVANHSSATDPVYIVLGHHPKVLYRIMAKRELIDTPVLGKLLLKLGVYPVDRDGTDAGAVMMAMKTLRAGQSLMLFPEGTRVRVGEKSDPKGGAVLLATRCNVPIVPVYVSREKRLFRPIRLVYGTPYHPQTSGKRLSAEEQERLTAEMMAKCYALGEEA